MRVSVKLWRSESGTSTHTMFSISLLLLLTASSYVYCYELTQPGSMMVQSGQSLSINCKTSYSVTNYTTAWIRQAAGKSLDWIGYINSGGSTGYNDKLKNKFSISRETSSNTITLQGQNLQTEDTAVYYCAKYYYGAFDYWGKGTTVTVTSAQQKKPQSLFPVSQCEPKDNKVTIGCLAPGLTAPDATFKWFDHSGAELTTFVQYPAARSNDVYTTVSHLTIKSSDWEADKPYKCRVQNSLGFLDQTLKPDPSVLVYTSDLHKNRITLVCEVSSLNVSIRWKVNDDKPQIDGNQTATIQKSDSGNFVHSYLTVSSAVYETSTFTCTAYHGDKMVAKPFTTSKSKPSCPPISCDD